MKMLKAMSVAAMVLGAGLAAQGQSGTVDSGSVALTLNSYLTDTLGQEGVAVTYQKDSNGTYNVTGGTTNDALSTGVVQTSGGLTFKDKKRKVELVGLAVEFDSNGTFLTAEVLEDGVDEGRYAVFSVVSSGPVSTSAKNKQKTNVSEQNLEFKINPVFVSEFMDEYSFPSFDPTQVLGMVSVSVVVTN